MQTIYQDISVDFVQQKYQKINAKAGDLGTRFLRISCYKDGVFVPLSSTTSAVYLRYKKSDDTGVFTQGTITNDGKVEIELVQQMLTCPGIAYADLLVIEPNGVVTDNNGHIMIETTAILSSMVFCVNVQQEALTDEDVLSTNDYSAISELIELAYINAETIAGYVETAEEYASEATQAATSATASATTATQAATSASASATTATEAATSASGSATSASTSANSASASATGAAESARLAGLAASDADLYMDHAEDYSLDAQAWANGKRGNEDVPSTAPQHNNHAKHYAESAMQDAQSADQASTNAQAYSLDAEAWAWGKKNGVDVPSTAPQYHKDAKYWAEQAQAIVGGQDNVKYTAQSGKTASEKAQARANIDAAKLGVNDTDSSWTANTDIRTLSEGTYIIKGQNSQFDYTSVMPSDWRKNQNFPSSGVTLLTITTPPQTDGLVHRWYTLVQQLFSIVAGAEKVDYKMWVASEAPTLSFTSSDWALVSMGGDIPIATTSVAGKVKPDGTSIRIDANGTISDYGNRLTEDEEWETVEFIESFTNGWHRIYDGQPMAQELYDWFPVTQTEISNGDAWLLIVKETPADTCQLHAEFVYQAYSNGSMRMWVLPNFCYDDDEPTASDWIEIKDVPIATLSTAGIVKPDGVSIKVDSNGVLRDYGNTLFEADEYATAHHVEDFTCGWHLIRPQSSTLNYSELPLTENEIHDDYDNCLLHIVNGYQLSSSSWNFWYYTAEFVATTSSNVMCKWILPLWYWDGDYRYPTASNWIRIDNVLHKPSSQYASRTLPMWGSGEIISAGMSVDDILTTSNSRKVVIQSSAPSDTTASWVK